MQIVIQHSSNKESWSFFNLKKLIYPKRGEGNEEFECCGLKFVTERPMAWSGKAVWLGICTSIKVLELWSIGNSVEMNDSPPIFVWLEKTQVHDYHGHFCDDLNESIDSFLNAMVSHIYTNVCMLYMVLFLSCGM